MKVFISQKMRGKTNDEIIKMREKIVEKFHISDDELIDNLSMGAEYKNFNNIELLGISIQLMGRADLVLMPKMIALPQETFNGIMVEREVATRYGIPIIFYDEEEL